MKSSINSCEKDVGGNGCMACSYYFGCCVLCQQAQQQQGCVHCLLMVGGTAWRIEGAALVMILVMCFSGHQIPYHFAVLGEHSPACMVLCIKKLRHELIRKHTGDDLGLQAAH
jgi:hypothetical protein